MSEASYSGFDHIDYEVVVDGSDISVYLESRLDPDKTYGIRQTEKGTLEIEPKKEAEEELLDPLAE